MPRPAAAVAALAAAALACGAAVEANRRSPGAMTKDAFAPARPPAAQYGPDAALACPSAGAFRLLATEVASPERGKAPEPDGRLCAAADTFLGWDRADLPPESVVRFVSWHFGLATAARVIVTTIDSEDSKVVADRLADTLRNFAASAARPRFGLATQRVKPSSAGTGGTGGSRASIGPASTKVALVMQDTAVDLQPVPRALPAKGEATLSGKLAAGRANPKVLVCTPDGKLEVPNLPAGDAFEVPLRCGDRPGSMLVEVRADENGSPATVARFPVACGVEVPRAVALSPAPDAAGGAAANAGDSAQQGRRMFDLLNADRQAAGLAPLAWDEGVAGVARAAAESYRDESGRGAGAPPFDIAGRLKKADVPSLVVLQIPLAAPDVAEAQALVEASPVNRCNLLNREITHAGVGVVPAKDSNGMALLYVSELFVRELAAVDTQAVRTQLAEAIARRRADARAEAAARDAALDDVAQKFAKELADAKGSLPDARANAIVAPLYQSFRSVNLLSGAKSDPMELAEEPGVIAKGKLMGVGVAQGANPVLGKNAVYVVILIGSRR